MLKLNYILILMLFVSKKLFLKKILNFFNLFFEILK